MTLGGGKLEMCLMCVRLMYRCSGIVLPFRLEQPQRLVIPRGGLISDCHVLYSGLFLRFYVHFTVLYFYCILVCKALFLFTIHAHTVEDLQVSCDTECCFLILLHRSETVSRELFGYCFGF